MDADDERLGDYRRLNDTRYRRRYETMTRSFIAEGPLAVERLLCSTHWRTRSVLLTAPMAVRLADPLRRRPVPIYVAEQAALDAVVGFSLHRGVVASSDRAPERSPAQLLARPTCLVAGVEGVNDHENLGALFRTRPPSASMPWCSTPPPPTRCTGAASASRSATC